MRCNGQWILGLWLSVISIGTEARDSFGGGGGEYGPPPSTLSQMLPQYVQELSLWPDLAALGSTVRVPKDAKEVGIAAYGTNYWLRRVVSKKWLPGDDVSPMFHRREFGGVDVVRLRWQHDGWDIQVSQTNSILAIVLGRADGTGTGDTAQERARRAEEICLQLFPRNTVRFDLGSERVPLNGVNERIARNLFKSGRRVEFADGAMWGRGKTAKEAGVLLFPQVEDGKVKLPQDTDRGWEESWQPWDYWFQLVRWWSDGDRIGFYFPKIETSSYDVRTYGSKRRNSGWFHLKKYRQITRAVAEEPEPVPRAELALAPQGDSPKPEPDSHEAPPKSGPQTDSPKEESAPTAVAPAPPKRNVLPLALGIGGVLLLAAALVLYRRQKTASN